MKLKEQTKPIEDKSDKQSKATTIFNDLIKKRKKMLTSVNHNNLKFEYIGPTKNVRFFE